MQNTVEKNKQTKLIWTIFMILVPTQKNNHIVCISIYQVNGTSRALSLSAAQQKKRGSRWAPGKRRFPPLLPAELCLGSLYR